jgi:hypothetical protein
MAGEVAKKRTTEKSEPPDSTIAEKSPESPQTVKDNAVTNDGTKLHP